MELTYNDGIETAVALLRAAMPHMDRVVDYLAASLPNGDPREHDPRGYEKHLAELRTLMFTNKGGPRSDPPRLTNAAVGRPPKRSRAGSAANPISGSLPMQASSRPVISKRRTSSDD